MGANLPRKTAPTRAGPSCRDPKTGLWGSLHAKKGWKACYTVPRHHKITVGPYLGVPRAPWVQQNPTCKVFTGFQPNSPYETAKTDTGPSCVTPKPVRGGPCRPPSAWMPPTVSQDATQSVWGPTMGSPGHPGSAKSKKAQIPGSPKKTQVETPKNAEKVKKSKFRKNGAVSSKLFA